MIHPTHTFRSLLLSGVLCLLIAGAWKAARLKSVQPLAFDRIGSSEKNNKAASHPAVTPSVRPKFSDWLERDPASALDYIEKISDVDERDRAFGRVARLMSEKDPAEAIHLVINNVHSQQLRSECVIDIFDDWVGREPAVAAHYAENLAPGDDRNKALFVIADKWTQANPTSAYIWMKSLPEFDGLRSTVF